MKTKTSCVITTLLLLTMIFTSCGDGNREREERENERMNQYNDTLMAPPYTPKDTLKRDTIDTSKMQFKPGIGTL